MSVYVAILDCRVKQSPIHSPSSSCIFVNIPSSCRQNLTVEFYTKLIVMRSVEVNSGILRRPIPIHLLSSLCVFINAPPSCKQNPTVEFYTKHIVTISVEVNCQEGLRRSIQKLSD